MYWNHRVVRIKGNDPEYQLAEVYYENGKPASYCVPFMVGETKKDLRKLVKRLQQATKRPIVNFTK